MDPQAGDSSANGDKPRSPNPHRSSPWSRVVQGGGDSPDSASPSPGTANAAKKQAWNTPSNGGSPSTSSDRGVAGVMGGPTAWPALSESTRSGPKSSPADSGSVFSSQGPITSHPLQPKQGSANANHNAGSLGVAPARQRSVKRGGGGGGGGGGNRQSGFQQGQPMPPPPPKFPVPEMAQSSFGNGVSLAPPDSSSRETRPGGGFAPRPQSVGDHSNHRSSHRRGGDGRNNYRGNRRDHNHGNFDWSSSQNPLTWNAHGHPYVPPPRGFLRPHVQGAPQFVVPPAVGPYGNSVFPDVPLPYPYVFYIHPPSDSFGGLPYLPPSALTHHVVADKPIHPPIVKQIDYYFSDNNLVKDEYLRSHMDEDGWVSIALIANFPMVQCLTNDIPLILQCLKKYSTVVEVQSNKVRRRHDWMKWITHKQSLSDSGVPAATGFTDGDMLTSKIQNASLERVNESVDESQENNGENPEHGVR